MKTLLVTGKGGSGKSTTSFNLAVAAHKVDLRVGLIDADPQCSISDMRIAHGNADIPVQACRMEQVPDRRAALHWCARQLLEKFMLACLAAANRNDLASVRRWSRMLQRLLDRVEPALERDPPLQPGVSSWTTPRSRWQAVDEPRPRRGQGSKKHALKRLPRNWMDRLWQKTPADWPWRSVLAVHMSAPSRGEDLAPGSRPNGWSPGARVRLHSSRRLEITVTPAKHHGGRYGLGTATTWWDPTLAGGPVAYLARLCASAGGEITVSLTTKNAMRKALKVLGERVFPELRETVVITPSLIRHQVIADLKASAGGGEEVAAAAGHSTDRTQARYGRVEHGRKRKGYLGAASGRKPSAGNVERTHNLAKQKKVRRPDDDDPDGS